MNFHSLSYRKLALAALAAFTLGLGSAQAQPAGPGPNGPGFGHGLMIEQAIQSLQGKLSLNTMQQTRWANAAAQTKAAHDSVRGQMQRVKDALAAELAKPEPDLAAVASVADASEAQVRALRTQTRDGWLQVYATFTPAQKAVVRDALQQKMSMMQNFRARMQQRMGS